MILISNDFCHKRKIYNFDPYNVLLSIATNIPVLLMTVLQGHLYIYIYLKCHLFLWCNIFSEFFDVNSMHLK